MPRQIDAKLLNHGQPDCKIQAEAGTYAFSCTGAALEAVQLVPLMLPPASFANQFGAKTFSARLVAINARTSPAVNPSLNPRSVYNQSSRPRGTLVSSD